MRWLRRLFGCAHRSTYFERRDVGGAKGIMHLVCADCGHAVPLNNRQSPPAQQQTRRKR